MVACATSAPEAKSWDWRLISYSKALCTLLKELRFFTSTLVPKGVPGRCTETLTSARILPSSGLASETNKVWAKERK